jgi:trimethylamine--corrinoid protein Co-methyltransferase
MLQLELRANVLSPDEVREVDRATIRVLSEVGVSIASEEACQLLDQAGARVDHKTGIVKIPEDLLRRSVVQARGRTVELFDRNGSSSIRLEGKKTYNISGFDATYTLDSETGERRPSTKHDVGEFAKLADALPNIHVVGTQAIPQDVPARSAELHAVETILSNTSKHCHFSPSDADVAKSVLKMVRSVCDGRDLFSESPVTLMASPTSPLRWEKNAIEALMEIASAGAPLHIISQPIAGITAPITLAGVLLLQNVETLTGLVVAQLLRPGTHVIYGFVPTVFDMREANAAIASPEGAIMRIASAQVAKYYGLPCLSAGPDTDAHVHDEQTAWEKAITGLAVYLGGADLMLNPGMFSSGLIVSCEQLVIDDEILGYVDRVVRGMRANADTLVVDLVSKVGHGGQFLKEAHTLKQFKNEYWIPEISCRAAFGRWTHKGSHDIAKSAKEKARSLLSEHHPQELSASTKERLTRVIKDFETRVAQPEP